MIVVLEPFALGSVEDRFGRDLDRGVEAALRHHVRRVRSRRRPPEVPRFMRDVLVDREASTEIQVSLPLEDLQTLNDEAGRQEVEFDRIVAHAVFVYIADIAAPAGSGDGITEENLASPRYHGHAKAPNARRPRGKIAGGDLLRHGHGSGGRGRFGRR